MRNKSDSTVARRKDILSLLAESGEVFVNELSTRYKVSEVTIRNDLDQLEQKNVLIRARGGAMKIDTPVAVDQRLSDKSKLNFQEKIRIGQKAASMVAPADTIIVDSGSTTAELVKSLKQHQDLTIITNALNIANILGNDPSINVIMPGGFLRKNSLSLVGPLAEKNLRNFNVDKVFLGVDGFDTRQGISTPNVEEASLNQIMIEIATEVIVLADSSKFSKRSLALICPVTEIDTVITDNRILPEDKKRLQDAGVNVVIA